MALSWLQGSVATFIRTDLLLLISSKSIKGHCFNQIHSTCGGLNLISDRAPPQAFYRFVNVVLQFITGLLAETDEGIKMLCLQWTARFPRSYGLSKVYDHMCDSE